VRAQSAQSAKVALANIVITNTGSYDDLWRQVSAAWKEIVPGAGAAEVESAPVSHPVSLPVSQPVSPPAGGNYTVRRGKPKNSAAIAELITRLSGEARKMTAEDVMEQFGEKAYMLLEVDGRLAGLAGWQVENLVTRTTDLYIEKNVDLSKAFELLMGEVERASSELQSEASLVFPTGDLASEEALWASLGYEKRTPETLGVQAWQDSAAEVVSSGGALLFKQLRQDRVLRPI